MKNLEVSLLGVTVKVFFRNDEYFLSVHYKENPKDTSISRTVSIQTSHLQSGEHLDNLTFDSLEQGSNFEKKLERTGEYSNDKKLFLQVYQSGNYKVTDGSFAERSFELTDEKPAKRVFRSGIYFKDEND